jgi:transglutaminase-like putative cysteine protease
MSLEELSPMDLDRYLTPSSMSDCDHPRLKQMAQEIAAGAENPTQAAQRVFQYVRDKIAFNATLDIFLKASQVIDRRTMDYCNKINIHVTLLRAIDIPARFHMVRARKEMLAHIVPGFLYRFLPSPVGHFWCECHLDGRWIACEALFDAPFYEGMLGAGFLTKEQIPTIEWDGQSDLVLMKHWIVADREIYSHYEQLTDLASAEGMPPKLFCKALEWLPAYYSRRRTNKIRNR